MAYKAKLEQAVQFIESHNKNVSEQSLKVDATKVLSHLKEIGAHDLASLAECKNEDLIEAGVPRLLARQITSTIFRVRDEGVPKHVSDKKAEHMNPEELLGRYVPDTDNAVSRRLTAMGGKSRFVVFEPGSTTVDVQTSAKLLKEVKDGFGERVDGIVSTANGPRRAYRVGEKPNNLVDENPLYPTRALRPDGTCDQTGRSWDGIPLEVRQLVALARQTGELSVTLDKAHDVLDRILSDPSQAMLAMATRYRKAALVFEEGKVLGTLPPLKVVLNANRTTGNDPFAILVPSTK